MKKGFNLKAPIDQWGPIDGRLLYESFWFDALSKGVLKAGGVPWPTYYALFDHDRSTVYWEKEAVRRQGEKALTKWILVPKKLKMLWQRYWRQRQAMRDFAKKLDEKIFRNNDFLAAAPFAKKLYQHVFWFWVVTTELELANFAAPKYLYRLLKPFVPPKELDGVKEALLAPERLSFHQTSELELLKIAVATKAQGKTQKLLQDYAREWHWVENSYYQSKKLGVNDFLKHIRGHTLAEMRRRIVKIQAYPKRVIERKKKIIRLYKLPRRVTEQAASMAFSIWWQDHRKALAWWAHSLIDKFSRVACKTFNLRWDEIMYYNAEEWAGLFTKSKTVPRTVIKQRKRLFLVKVTEKGYKIFYGKQAEDFKKFILGREKVKETSIIKGITTSRVGQGRVTGEVKVLLSPRFAHIMKDGEILVAPMTSPDYIVAMRKAKAIVTDVGGLMSHAAVVSRELGIPCIVNTKIATKVFKDGDLVEVDADKGIVKKI